MIIELGLVAGLLYLGARPFRRFRRWPDPQAGAPLGRVPPKPALWQQLDRGASSWKVMRRGRRA